MNISLHLPARQQPSPVRHFTPRTVLTNAFRHYDDRPEFERNVSPSELAMRETNSIPTMRR